MLSMLIDEGCICHCISGDDLGIMTVIGMAGIDLVDLFGRIIPNYIPVFHVKCELTVRYLLPVEIAAFISIGIKNFAWHTIPYSQYISFDARSC